jgi:hypothetical protein
MRCLPLLTLAAVLLAPPAQAQADEDSAAAPDDTYAREMERVARLKASPRPTRFEVDVEGDGFRAVAVARDKCEAPSS